MSYIQVNKYAPPPKIYQEVDAYKTLYIKSNEFDTNMGDQTRGRTA